MVMAFFNKWNSVSYVSVCCLHFLVFPWYGFQCPANHLWHHTSLDVVILKRNDLLLLLGLTHYWPVGVMVFPAGLMCWVLVAGQAVPSLLIPPAFCHTWPSSGWMSFVSIMTFRCSVKILIFLNVIKPSCIGPWAYTIWKTNLQYWLFHLLNMTLMQYCWIGLQLYPFNIVLSWPYPVMDWPCFSNWERFT